MANLFKRAALAFGRLTGISPKPTAAEEQAIAPVEAEAEGGRTSRIDSDIDAVLFSAYLAETRTRTSEDGTAGAAAAAIEVEATADVAVIGGESTASTADGTDEGAGEYMMQVDEVEAAFRYGDEEVIASTFSDVGEVAIGELPTIELAAEEPFAEVAAAVELPAEEAITEVAAEIEQPAADVVVGETEVAAAAELPAAELSPVGAAAPDGPVTPWGGAIESTGTAGLVAPCDAGAVIATHVLAEPAAAAAVEPAATYTLIAGPEQAAAFVPLPFAAEPVTADASGVEAAATEVDEKVDSATPNLIEALIFPAQEHFEVAPAAVVAQSAEDAVTVAPLVAVEADHRVPVEIKPLPKAGVSFTKLYKLISGEAGKRTDDTVAAYERLLESTRAELDVNRKGGRLAWSVGGVMTAVAAFGAIYSAGEISAARVEVAALKQQVTSAQQVVVERDQLRADLGRTREVSAKVEIDALKARLDQALTVSADRERLRGELEIARKAKQEAESELRVARAAAAPATQPVSQAQPAAGKVFGDRSSADRVAGSERADVWSVLLNGEDRR